MAYRTRFGDPNKRVLPGYSVWVNLLDYSAAVLPVTTVDKSVDVVDEGYKPINAMDEKVWKSCEFLILVVVGGNELTRDRRPDSL